MAVSLVVIALEIKIKPAVSTSQRLRVVASPITVAYGITSCLTVAGQSTDTKLCLHKQQSSGCSIPYSGGTGYAMGVAGIWTACMAGICHD